MREDEITSVNDQTTEGYSHHQAVDALANSARRGTAVWTAVQITVARSPGTTMAEMVRGGSLLLDEEEILVYFSDEEEV